MSNNLFEALFSCSSYLPSPFEEPEVLPDLSLEPVYAIKEETHIPAASPIQPLISIPPIQQPVWLSNNACFQSNARRQPSKRRIPRPRNSFIIYRSEMSGTAREYLINAGNTRPLQQEITKRVSEMWKLESELTKEIYRLKFLEEKKLHQIMASLLLIQYPNYKFSPVKKRKTV